MLLKLNLSVALLTLAGSQAISQDTALTSYASPNGTTVYADNWESIADNYKFPDWYRDAKFGIFIHWGPYSVPAFENEWYSRNMYQKGQNAFNHHRETWGDQSEFGYKDFIPMFKGEAFDADEWISLLKSSGAKYIVPVAEHHDGFAMYDSELNEWNAMDMGPKRDIIGELKSAAKKAGLAFGLSSHRMENAWFFNGGMDFDSDVQDTTITLYGRRYAEKAYTDEWGLDWLAHTREIVDKYQPDLIYFDWTVNEEKVMPYFNILMAYYYNSAKDWGRDVVINTKHGYPANIMVWDVERGKSDKMMTYPWQTCTSIGKRSWSYIDGEENKTPRQIVHDLIDIVSKNGNLLLNIGPRADGTITDEQKSVLLEIGKWLGINGEAIYGTRCWKHFGEGDTQGSVGSFSDSEPTDYKASDIRFTTKGNDLYAIVLGWDEEVTIKSLTPENIGSGKVLDVKLLGSEEKISWQITGQGLNIIFPDKQPCDYAYSFRISFDKPVGENLPPESSTEKM